MVERCGNQIDGEGAKRVGKTIVKVNEKIIKRPEYIKDDKRRIVLHF